MSEEDDKKAGNLFAWCARYYPETADQAVEREVRAFDLRGRKDIPPVGEMALRLTWHSLRKWQGLRPAALKEHGVAGRASRLRGNDSEMPLGINCDSCALCAAYIDTDKPHGIGRCGRCPLFRHLGRACGATGAPGGPSPYNIWWDSLDPEPMIAALEGTLEMLAGLKPAAKAAEEEESEKEREEERRRLLDACRGVVKCWESGDLAAAVRECAAAADEAARQRLSRWLKS